MLAVLSLAVIKLYLDNPRLSKSDNEAEAMNKIVADQQKKLVALAKDIAKHKLSELDVMAVFPDEEDGFYRVAEGNRRITVLKLLQNPNLIKDNFPAIAREFSEIEGRENFDFEHINVSIFPSENDETLIHFLQIRHLGEYGGVGTVRWDAKQKGRFDYRIHGTENLVIFLDELERNEILTAEQINGVTKTNWDRILRSVGLEFFHLDKVSGTYNVEAGFEEEFNQKIRMVADALYKKTVGIVYDQEKIEEFFAKMERQYNGQADEGAKPESSTVGEVPPTSSTSDDDAAQDTNEQNKQRRMPSDPFKNCQFVIPPQVRIQSRNHRITQIIQELKEISVERYTNASGCLLRALIELCAKEYLEHNNHNRLRNGDATSIEFSEAISAAKDDMVQKGLLTATEGRAINKETEGGGVRQLFNGYMHNTDSYPSSVVIKGIFQFYYKFLKLCLY